MDDFRSKSCTNRPTQTDFYTITTTNPKPKTDFRSYSTSSTYQPQQRENRDFNFNKVKSTSGSSKAWTFTDPETQRKKRVASYRAYDVEGKMKGSLRKSLRWIKDRCTQAVHGWR